MSNSSIIDRFLQGEWAPMNAENDLAFRKEIQRLSVVGMRLTGILAILGPILLVAVSVALTERELVLWGQTADNVRAVADDALIVMLGFFILFASLSAIGARFGRTITVFATILMFVGVVAGNIAAGVSQAAPLSDAMTFVILMLVVTGAMPLRYWQTMAFGAALIIVYLIGVYTLTGLFSASLDSSFGNSLVLMSMITLFSSGISAYRYNINYGLFRTRKEEEALRRKTALSERKYRSIFEDSSDAIFVINDETDKLVEVNRSFEELMDRDVKELSEMSFSDLVVSADSERLTDLKEQLSEAEATRRCQLIRVIRKSVPTPVFCELTLHTNACDPGFTMGAMRDVTTEMEARERSEKLANIPEENPNPVIRSDYDGKITYKNPSAQNLTEELGIPDTPIEDMFPDNYLADVRRSIDTGETIVNELHKTQGRIFTVTYNPDCAAREANVWMTDVTERVRAFEKIQSFAEELESTNRELHETRLQLVQREKMAALGNLVAGVAHEINTPLGAINSNVDVSQRALRHVSEFISSIECEMAEDARAKTQKILAILGDTTSTMHLAVERIVEIVRSLKNFARLDEAEFKLADLHEGIDSTLTLLTHELKGRVTVVKEYGELPMVNCSPNRLNQVFMNILVNATHAIEGNGTITITTSMENDMARLEFKDTGVGIAEEDLKLIFDPGFTTKGVGVGTGLGLSIVYRIIEEHNGSIDVDSEEGKGTTMTIRIPAK